MHNYCQSYPEDNNPNISERNITHIIQDTPGVVSDHFENIIGNIGNIEKYFTRSCSEGPNKQFLLNLFIQSLAGINEASSWLHEQIHEKLTLYEMSQQQDQCLIAKVFDGIFGWYSQVLMKN